MVVMKWRVTTDATGNRALSAAWTPVTVPELPSPQAAAEQSREAALRAS
ncbi:MAG: hypothetical protein R2720_14725 [Candidatus Nanopelagicales bacterium]